MSADTNRSKPLPKKPRGYSRARRVGSFVPKLTKKVFEKYGFSTAALLTDWANIVGKDMAQATLPDRLKWPRHVDAYADVDSDSIGRPGATLILRVDPARALDVQYEASQLIDRINAYFGYAAISEIRIHQAPITQIQAPSEPQPANKMTLNQEDLPASQELAKIEDEKLRAALNEMAAGLKADQIKNRS